MAYASGFFDPHAQSIDDEDTGKHPVGDDISCHILLLSITIYKVTREDKVEKNAKAAPKLIGESPESTFGNQMILNG